MKAKTVVILVLVVLAVIIAFQNTERVPVSVLFWEFGMPRIIMMLITLIVGIIIGYVAATLRCFRRDAPPRQRIDTDTV